MPVASRPPKPGKLLAVLVACWFLALSVLFTRPVAFRGTREVAGQPGDNLYFVWLLDWYERAVFDLHQSPVFDPWLNFPEGWSLASTSVSSGDGLAWPSGVDVRRRGGRVQLLGSGVLLSVRDGSLRIRPEMDRQDRAGPGCRHTVRLRAVPAGPLPHRPSRPAGHVLARPLPSLAHRHLHRQGPFAQGCGTAVRIPRRNSVHIALLHLHVPALDGTGRGGLLVDWETPREDGPEGTDPSGCGTGGISRPRCDSDLAVPGAGPVGRHWGTQPRIRADLLCQPDRLHHPCDHECRLGPVGIHALRPVPVGGRHTVCGSGGGRPVRPFPRAPTSVGGN